LSSGTYIASKIHVSKASVPSAKINIILTSKRFLDLFSDAVLQESPGRTEPPASETTAEGEEGQKESIDLRNGMSNMPIQWSKCVKMQLFTIFYIIISIILYYIQYITTHIFFY